LKKRTEKLLELGLVAVSAARRFLTPDSIGCAVIPAKAGIFFGRASRTRRVRLLRE
jgi:stage V sporulation protein SpoVS